MAYIILYGPYKQNIIKGLLLNKPDIFRISINEVAKTFSKRITKKVIYHINLISADIN